MIRRRILAAATAFMVALSGLVGGAWGGSNAYAAQTAQVGGNSLKVSPVRQNVVGDPGTTQTVTVTVQNISSVPARLHAALNDFTSSPDESGTPSVILDESRYAPSHSLKRFMLPVSDFNLPGNGAKDVKLTIKIPKDAAGGGYFGAIRFEPVNPAGDKILNLSASVGSLILLKVNGNIKEQLSIASFDVRQDDKPGKFFTNNKNLKVVVRFKNEGNVQVDPFGKLLAQKSGKDLWVQEINTSTPRGSVLPDSIRKFEVSAVKIGAFGRYTIRGSFGYGSSGELITASTKIYVVPVGIIVLAVVAVLVLLFLIFVLPRMIKSYNKRVIRKASRRR